MQPSGEYAPAGEEQPGRSRFSATEIAAAFEVSVERVHRAIAGEFGLAGQSPVDSRQAQHLAEVLLADRPQAERDASLMHLGAYTPRADHEWGIGEAPPGEESDRVAGDDDHVSQH
jgi:hypothetical protein